MKKLPQQKCPTQAKIGLEWATHASFLCERCDGNGALHP
jgi:hypothetical protein